MLNSSALVVEEYRAAKGQVKYACPSCGDRLTSSLSQAGSQDFCPACNSAFIVPGVKELAEQKLVRSKQLESQRKKAELAEQHRETAKAERNAKAASSIAKKSAKKQRLQLDKDPILEWAIYAVICLGFLAFAVGPHIVKAITTDSTMLCVIILGLFGIGVVLNFISVWQLRAEYVCAAACMQKLTANGIKKVMMGFPAGIFHRHVQQLGNIAKYDDNFTQDSLVTLLYSRLMSKAKIVDILSNVLVSLGLIGTILGLINMTDGLSAAMESLSGEDGAASLLDGMRTTMSGLGTAFYTTLIGAMLGSVVLRVLNNVFTSSVDLLVTYIARTAEVQIGPQL
ncbi:MAG: MotA/TolQ/ExbB proton channel family protein [Planctomycetaceae bacterium]